MTQVRSGVGSSIIQSELLAVSLIYVKQMPDGEVFQDKLSL